MTSKVFHCIPVNVACWLQDIRYTAEDYYDYGIEWKYHYYHRVWKNEEENSSNESIYDNVDRNDFKTKRGEETNDEKVIETNKSSSLSSPLAEEIVFDDVIFAKDFFSKSECPTWPMRKFSKMQDRRSSLKNILEYILFKLKMIKTILNLSDIIYGKDFGEFVREEKENGKTDAFMSNLLASYRDRHIRESVWTWLNDLPGLLTPHKPDFSGFLNVGISADKPPVPPKRKKRKTTQWNRCRFVTPRRRRHAKKLNYNSVKGKEIAGKITKTITNNNNNADSSTCSDHFSNDKVESGEKSNLLLLPYDVLKFEMNNEDVVDDNVTAKPLPFPLPTPELEFEINELLMMQRVTESSKTRRLRRRCMPLESKGPFLDKSNDIVEYCVKDIPNALPAQLSKRSTKESFLANEMSNVNLKKIFDKLSREMIDAESQKKVETFLKSKFLNKNVEYLSELKTVKLREDVIIDWENDYENLNEPVILEGKSISPKGANDRSGKYWKNGVDDDDGDRRISWESATETCVSRTESFSQYENVKQSSNEYMEKYLQSREESESLCGNNNNDNKYQECETVPSISSSKTVADTSTTTKTHKTSLQVILSDSNDKFTEDSGKLKSESETFDKISITSDDNNSFSDFDSEYSESGATPASGVLHTSWCNENDSLTSLTWELSSQDENDERREDNEIHNDYHDYRPLSYCSTVESNFSDSDSTLKSSYSGKIFPNETRVENKKENEEVKFHDKSRVNDKIFRSKSLDFFRDSLTESRCRGRRRFDRLRDRNSVRSDVCDWMAKIRGIVLSEDDEWILSFDSEERAYFFEETSKKSLWALPDYSISENSKPEFNYSIQRSATESAIIPHENETKLRQSKDGDKNNRISASVRSSKAQSMLIEPKFDIPANNGNKAFSMPRDLTKIYGEIIYFGVLNKTKISENGKKLRKNWTPAFAVLTESYLFFFKDAKSFQNMKNVVGVSNNHMCLNLQGALIEKGDKISSRKNVYKISCSDNTDVLIQTEKTAEADEWFKEISLVIQNLPPELNPPPPPSSSSPLFDLSSPSKVVGRTKSLKVRTKDNTGSMEDLSSTSEDRQNKIKAKLKKFFIRRPTVDSLKKKGIWKDEPVFGCSLEQITKNRNPRVPVFVEKCIECIESKEENMKTDGLYRASGNLSQVQKIRLEVDQNNLNIMKDEEDVHVLTGSLKLFFRELKEPLIPSKQLEPALLATDKQGRKERIKDFQKIVKSLPTPNYDTLKFLLQHLLRVKEYHKFNRMNINNLAIVFGPTLMWPEQESANMALELMQQNVVIECLLKEYQEIFT
ncbi:Rho GTPase activating protein, putative [Pediculus humanus corporis]|uniref:Rho GTPase activating protein, putative n=1 Tax=Pediculus humanus subsp. corporis TaxID=121224 RepID=E0VNR9_PEDHC|nr:Rho GTPase activating protein, putative [Pediculus humanus corporis]EEB15025.1 Rho GTPase activating protein, putative [Pediculus humanus corporis]